MRFDAFDTAVRKLPGVVFDVKWGSDRTYCIGGKMFVVAGDLGKDEPRYVFKASDLGFEMLVDSGACTPAPYLGRSKWVQMAAPDSLSDEDLMAYIAQSHALVAAKLTKKQRAELGIG